MTMEEEYKEKMRLELKRYNMSFKAFVLGQDSWYIGFYLRALRIVAYNECRTHIFNKLLGGGVSRLDAMGWSKIGIPNSYH